MTEETRRAAGWLIIVLPTVIIGGVSLLSLLIFPGTGYEENPIRQSLWRAGHAHAGVLLILSLLAFLYVDQANLSKSMKQLVRISIPLSAILLPAAFFLSVLPPDASEPNGLISLAYIGAISLGTGLLVLGIGLVKRSKPR